MASQRSYAESFLTAWFVDEVGGALEEYSVWTMA